MTRSQDWMRSGVRSDEELAKPFGDLSGRTAIVTGGGMGIGRAICVELARCGAAVATCDIAEEGLATTQSVLDRIAQGSFRGQVVDVSDPLAVGEFIADIQGAFGPVTLLVNNAGGVSGQVRRPIEEVSESDWDHIFRINSHAAFRFIRLVVPSMKEQGLGSIVNIASGAGRSYSLTGVQAYAAAKAAIIGLTRQAAHDLGPVGIRVNCVSPGFVRSNPTTERQWEAMGPSGQQALLEGIPLRRLGVAEDIAHAVRFLLSDDASYITGQTLSVDGGRQMFG
ncbi:MAG: SDR family NAD(P)-dependent oxidoreductase [Candidatus Dormiibacterota bacterium]